MPTEHSLSARRALVSRLSAVPEISAVVSDRVFGPKVPANPSYPMIRVGLQISTPFEATGIEGMISTFNVDCISDSEDEGEAIALSRLVVDHLDQQVFVLDEGEGSEVLSLDWTGSTPQQEDRLWRVMTGFRLMTQQSA